MYSYIYLQRGKLKTKYKQKQKTIQEELHKVSKKALRFVIGVHIHMRK